MRNLIIGGFKLHIGNIIHSNVMDNSNMHDLNIYNNKLIIADYIKIG